MVLASVPRNESDTAIYQNLHEIKVTKVKSINFDSDIQRLSAEEKSHREALPLRLSAPMERVMKTPYRSKTQKQTPVHHPRSILRVR